MPTSSFGPPNRPPTDPERATPRDWAATTFRGDIDSLDAAESFLYSRLNYEATPRGDHPFRLQRMRDLVAAADLGHWLYNPDDRGVNVDPSRQRARIVHIAGTKGKGSTTTILQSILTAAGVKVGTYTSPHLENLRGRFRVGGHPIDPPTLIQSVRRIAVAVAKMGNDGDATTFFELTTAVAVDVFQHAGCDVVILEVGLGGRLDSTNVFDAEIAAVTTIGLDHQHILGHDHASIATEKCGIFKRGRPAHTSVRHVAARRVVIETASRLACPLRCIDRDFRVDGAPAADWGSDLTYTDRSSGRSMTAPLAIEGDHQGINAALAIDIATKHFDAPESAVRRGLAGAGPPARLERFPVEGRTVLLDTAHNADSVAALVRVLKHRLSGEVSRTLLFAASRDKDARTMLDRLAGRFDRVILTKFNDNPRAAEPNDLRSLIVSDVAVEIIDDPIVALNRAVEVTDHGGWIVACGSFFLAAVLRQSLRGGEE